MKTKERESLHERIRRHGQDLLNIFPNAKERDPVALCKKLRRLEAQASIIGLRMCNGPEYAPGEADTACEVILAKVNKLLGNDRPPLVPVFINRDPRGYALKIEDAWIRENMHRGDIGYHLAKFHHDWGGYGIIAPDLTEGE